MTVTNLRASVRGDDSADMLYEYLTPLRPYLRQPDVTEVVINRPGEIWTEGARGWESFDAPGLTFENCMQLARLIANHNGKAISWDKPLLSAGLIYGERVQVVIPPACEGNTVSFTIRKPSILDKTLDELEADGAFLECAAIKEGLSDFEQQLMELKKNGQIKDFLDLAVRRHRNILIVGKTGSGKTTVAKSLIRSIPPWERLITLEDVHELFLHHHRNKVHLFYAREDEGGSKVTPKQALASCLRMRPDRILLAELRGDEAWEFIKSINTGHPGSISTMHANGAFEAFDQLTALIKDSLTGAHLDAAYIKRRLFTTLDVILFYHNRKLREIYYDPIFKRQQMV
jgi:type IV secretion system protein VirB11